MLRQTHAHDTEINPLAAQDEAQDQCQAGVQLPGSQNPGCLVTWVACLCPISQQSQEGTPDPSMEARSQEEPRETSKGAQHRAGSWPSVKEFPQASAFQHVLHSQGVLLGHLGGGDRKKEAEGLGHGFLDPGPLLPGTSR